MNHEDVRSTMRDSDSFLAVETITKSGDTVTAAKLFLSIANELYWKSKDLPAAISISSAGIAFGLMQAQHETDHEIIAQLRGTAKAIAYNLGSFCWPGWAEPGIDIDAGECAIGHDAARCNLRLAIELSRPAKAMGNAHWLIGAYELALRQFDAAIGSFERARESLADERAMALMAAGYCDLARHLQSRDSTSSQQAMNDSLSALMNDGSDDAKFFAEQIPAAEKGLRDWFASNPE